MKKTILLLIASSLFSFKAVTAQAIENGKDIIQAMYDTYEGKWYKNLTFEQQTIFYGPNETVQRTQTWFEAIKMPGKLAIKFDEKDGQSGILFSNNVQYGFLEGELIQQIPRIHDLLVLGFDVYHQPVDTTISQLEQTGYDLDKWYEDEWQGREVYVIGTGEADTEANQFWIDKERLVFVRSLKVGRQNSIQDTRFNKYERLGEGWIAPEVVFLVNGDRAMFEEYSRIHIPDSLSDEIFDPGTFIGTVW